MSGLTGLGVYEHRLGDPPTEREWQHWLVRSDEIIAMREPPNPAGYYAAFSRVSNLKNHQNHGYH
jgi:hypothetical protein